MLCQHGINATKASRPSCDAVTWLRRVENVLLTRPSWAAANQRDFEGVMRKELVMLPGARLRVGADFGPSSNTVAVTVGRLRRKLGDPPLIETVVGVGYRL